MAVVLDFDGGVDAAGGDEVDRGAVGLGGHDTYEADCRAADSTISGKTKSGSV